MLELKEVSKFYSNNGITNIGLSNINLKLNRNEIVAIVGESGSGKSTLLNVISKNDVFDEGEIYFYGNETSYFSISDMDDFRKNKVTLETDQIAQILFSHGCLLISFSRI